MYNLTQVVRLTLILILSALVGVLVYGLWTAYGYDYWGETVGKAATMVTMVYLFADWGNQLESQRVE